MSLADAEARKDSAEHIVGRNLAEDAAEGVERIAQFRREQFRFAKIRRAAKRFAGCADFGAMAGVEREFTAGSFAEGKTVELLAELLQVFADLRTDEQFARRF